MTKKAWSILISVVVVLAVAVTGTLAYLQQSSEEVVNTFVAGNIGVDEDDFEITETGGGTYTIIPGVDIAKDPAIVISGTNTIKAILFVKVVQSANWDNTNMTYALNSAWTALDAGATAQPTGVYYQVVDANTTAANYQIIENDKVKIVPAMTNAEVEAANNATLAFTAYICQYDGFAGTTNTEIAAAAWAACFNG